MPNRAREKFATQVNAERLMELRSLAQAEGRQLQALVDETLVDLVEKHKHGRTRLHVLATYQASHENTPHFTRSWLNDGLSHRY